MISEPAIVELGPFSVSGAVPTSWATAVDALRRTPKFWLTSVRPDGRPHVTPLLATVALDGLCFVTGPSEQKSKNLHRNPNAILTTGVNTLTATDYIIEGTASVVEDRVCLAEAADTFGSTFGWHLTHPDGNWYGMGDAIRNGPNELWQILPARGFAHADGAMFSQTRYIWPR